MQRKIYTAILLLVLSFNNASAQIITTIIGDGTSGTDTDGSLAVAAWTSYPVGARKGYGGKIYYSEQGVNKIRFIDANGALGTLAGNGADGYSGDGGLAINAQLSAPSVTAADNAGNFYFADQGYTAIRKVNAAGIITTVAGGRGYGYSGDGGPAVLAQFKTISGICLDNTGNNLYISDWFMSVVRKVDLTTGIITRIAGTGALGFSGDGGPAITAVLNGPYGMATDNAGNLYITDSDNKRVRKINPAGIITTIAGTGISANTGDGGPATAATFKRPIDITIDPANNLYVFDTCGTIRKITTAGVISRIAGTSVSGYSGDNGPPLAAQIDGPTISVDATGVIYISDYGRNMIRKIYCPDIIIWDQSTTDTSICTAAGTTAHFYIDADYASNYQWQLNTGTGWNNITNNATYAGATTTALDIAGITGAMNNYQYRCYTTNNCTFKYSSTITLHADDPVASVITIAASSNNICPGTSVTFTATATNTGTTPIYRWFKNGALVYGSLVNTWTANFITNGDNISCEVIPSSTCRTAYSFLSNTINMVVLNQPVPVITVNASSNNICTGTSVTFTASVTNPGTTPVYQWKKNGVSVGTNSTTYTDNTLNNGDVIYCDYSYTGACGAGTVTGNRIIMVVNTVGPPTIYIRTSDASGCTGLLFNSFGGITQPFDAVITNGGSAPVYQWKKNGVNVGGNLSTYSSVLNLGDVVSCVVTSNSPCASPVSATSNQITVDFAVDVIPTMSLTSSPATCALGMPVTYTAHSMYAGGGPVYLWKKNGVTVGSNSNTYIDNAPVDGDIVTCMITCSASCLLIKNTSAALVYHCDACGNSGQTINTIISSPPGMVPEKPTLGYGGNLYYSSVSLSQVYKFTPAGTVVVIAGTGAGGYSGDGGPATSAQLNFPGPVVTASDGTVYFTDQNSTVLRKINPATGVITTIANTAGTGGEGSLLGSIHFQSIKGLAIDNANNLYIADEFFFNVKKANMTTGVTNTIAGIPGFPGYGFAGDGGPATSAKMSAVQSVAVDNAGNIYIADRDNLRVRKVNAAGIISTYAGNGITAELGDGGPATSASFLSITDVSVDNAGNLYITDNGNGIRKVDQNGIILRVAGTGTAGMTGDGGPATSAQINCYRASVDPSGGAIYISQVDGMIRKVSCAPIIINHQPIDTTLCNAPGNTYFSVKACGANAYQWQVNTGSGWTDIINNILYSGATADTIKITGATVAMNNYQYRCHVFSDCNVLFSAAATLTVKTTLPSSISIASAITTMCQGANGIFTATPVNGGAAPAYQWKKNGTNTGTNSNTYSDNTLVNGDLVTCVLTASSDGCAATVTATSNVITAVIIPTVTPTIAITASANNICGGTPVTFSLTSANGGSSPFYQWQKNGVNIATGTTYTDNTLVNGDVVRCALLSNAPCQAASGLAFSNDITMNIVTAVVPTIAITASANNVCAGTSVTFNSTITNGGATPVYQWKKNGINVGTNTNSYTDNTFTNADVITCVLTSGSACATTPTVTSNGVTMIINPTNSPSVNITATATTICAGTSVTFSSTIANGGGTPGYQWKKNGVNVGTNSYSYTDNALNNGDVITCVLSSGAVCALPATATSNSVTMIVNPVLTPSISIAASGNSICPGTAITFSSTIVNGGTAPVYQWKKNGANVGANNNSYTDNTLVNGDIITCVLTSNAVCVVPATATSNTVTIMVNPLLIPSVSITGSVNNICAGTTVAFTSSIVNGGPAPVYQWKKNGVNVGANSNSYTDNALNNGDIITCVLSSNALCAAPVSATSNSITMLVNPMVAPVVSITATSNNICVGQSGSFTAVVANGGTAPVYQWKKNGINVGTNSNSYTDNALTNNDAISCTVTSNANCLTTSSGNSNVVVMTIHDNPVVTLDQTPTLCTGATRVLDPGPFASYVWSGGQTSRTITVNAAGTYSVIVTDNNDCKGNASATITTMLPQPGGFLPSDTSFCNLGKLTLHPYTAYNSYNWSTGEASSSITINQPGDYWLEVKDNNDCKGMSTVHVIMNQCLKGLYVPTAFSPNHDGKNDFFQAQLFGDIKKYELIIYNRQGNEIFRTKNPSQGWDGMYRGTELSTQVLVWFCSYQLNGEESKVEKGTVTLIR